MKKGSTRVPLVPPLLLPMLLPLAVCTNVQVCGFAWPQRKHQQQRVGGCRYPNNAINALIFTQYLISTGTGSSSIVMARDSQPILDKFKVRI